MSRISAKNTVKKVVIYGVGLQGEKFYCKYKDEFDILFAIDRESNRLFHGIPVISIEDICLDEAGLISCASIGVNKAEVYIYITTGFQAYAEIRTELKNKGMRENIDFTFWGGIGRKHAILYGNCHMDVLADYLKHNIDFYREYDIRVFYVASDKVSLREPSDEEIDNCDLLISQDIKDDNAVYVMGCEKLVSRVRTDCKVIIIPNLLGYNLFFPSLERSSNSWRMKHIGNDACIHYIGHSASIVNGLSDWRDTVIDELYNKGYCIASIVDEIKYGQHWSNEQIIDNYTHALNRVEEREKECDIVISDYIIKNYKQKKLYYDPWHPSRELIHEKGRRILNRLGYFPQCDGGAIHANDVSEVFIYGQVMEILGMQFEQKYIRRINQDYTLIERPMNIHDYVECYIKWNLD